MGHWAWVGLGVALITSSGMARAQAAPPVPPGTLPAPVPAAVVPPAAAEPSSPVAAPLPPPPAPPPNANAAPPAAAPPQPAVYPYPYAYPVYPPPPPPGYPYGYYYPPALERPKPRFPDDAAVTSTPFFDLLVVGTEWQDRFSQFLNLGGQAGVFLGRRVRLTARGAFPTDTGRDDYYSGDPPFGTGYTQVRSKSYSFLYGAGAGVVAISSQSFAMSPGMMFARTDVSDYGSMVGVSLPFDWVLGSGLRVGLELDFGRAFGGRYGLSCTSSPCASGPLTVHDRPAGTAFWLQFQFGFGLNHPPPLPPEAPAPAPAAR